MATKALVLLLLPFLLAQARPDVRDKQKGRASRVLDTLLTKPQHTRKHQNPFHDPQLHRTLECDDSTIAQCHDAITLVNSNYDCDPSAGIAAGDATVLWMLENCLECGPAVDDFWEYWCGGEEIDCDEVPLTADDCVNYVQNELLVPYTCDFMILAFTGQGSDEMTAVMESDMMNVCFECHGLAIIDSVSETCGECDFSGIAGTCLNTYIEEPENCDFLWNTFMPIFELGGNPAGLADFGMEEKMQLAQTIVQLLVCGTPVVCMTSLIHRHQVPTSEPQQNFEVAVNEASCQCGGPVIDGALNILDVVTLVNIILGTASGDECSGDKNGDGTTDVLDVVLMVNTILGL